MDRADRVVWVRIIGLCLVSIVVGACGAGQTQDVETAQGIAPESFVNCEAFQRANERREREERALSEARELLTTSPCEVADFDVPDVQHASFNEAFTVLRAAAEQSCRAGITGLRTTRDAEGRLHVESADGGFVSGAEATFVLGEDAVELRVPHEEVAQTRGLIDGFNGTPAHSIYMGESSGVVIEAEPGTELLVRGDRFEPTSIGADRDDRSAHLFRGEAGDVLEVFARVSDDAADAAGAHYRFSVSTLPEAVASIMPSWRPGEEFHEQYMLEGPMRAASAFGEQCYGSIPREPTTELLVRSRGWAAIGAESSEDAIIAVISPDGVSYCNDDWNGLNPLVEVELTEGVWQIYVGAWSEDSRFPFELMIEPR